MSQESSDSGLSSRVASEELTLAEGDEFDEELEATDRPVGVLTESERELIDKIGELGIRLRELDNAALIFEDTAPGGRMPSRRVAIPRSSVGGLAAQIKEDRVSHPTMVGFAVPARGYLEVVLDMRSRPGISPFMPERILSIPTSDLTCIHSEPEKGLLSLPFEGRLRRQLAGACVHLSSPGPGLPCLELSNASPMAALLFGYGTYSRLAMVTIKVAHESPQKPGRLMESDAEVVRSLLYEMDVRNGRAVSVRKHPSPDARPQVSRWRPIASQMRYPKIKVQGEVSDLFGFASQANDNPPLAFLSFYQTLEYFLPAAVRQNAFKKIRQELRDPMFDERSDGCLIRVVSAAERSVNQPEIGQLRVLVNEYVRSDRLEEFFTMDWGVHFKKQGPISGVEIINPGNASKSLCDQVAERIYQIRNRIVHAKDDPRYGEARVLLPRSPEAEALGPDVELVRLVATEAILGVQGP